jgi:hypothetical protein
MSRDILALLGDPMLVACCLNGQLWPRHLLTQTPVPDGWMGLVEARDDRRRFVPTGQDPSPEREEKLTLVRARPLSVMLSTKGTPAQDDKLVSGACEVVLRWEAREDDLAALRRGLLAHETLTLPQLAEALRSAGGMAALQQFVKSHAAAELVSSDLREALRGVLQEHLKRFLFETGARLEGVSKLELRSEMLERELALQRDAQQRVQAIQAREIVESAARAAMTRRIQDMSGVLEKLRAAAANDNSLRWHELLPALSPPERGRLLENLWRLTPDRRVTSAIVVVGGDECVWLEPQSPESIRSRVKVPEDLGGVRSVRHVAERGWLLVGAATGVWVLRESDGAVVMRCAVPMAGRPKTGFNSACIAGEHLLATHSQLGFWRWALDGSVKPLPLLETRDGMPKAVRAVTPLPDGRAFYAVDARVQVYDPASEQVDVLTSVDGIIHCLAVHDASLLIGTDRGTLLRCDWLRPDDVWAPYRRSGPLESVQVRAWHDLVELVVPGGDSGILAVYEQENIVARLASGRFPIRQAWAGDDLLVGLSDRRDMLLVMHGASSAGGAIEAPLARLLGTTVQDVCLVTRAAESAPQA